VSVPICHRQCPASAILKRMRAPSVKVTRRYLIGIIALTLGAVFFNYLQTWRERSTPKRAPQMLGSEMKRSAKNVEYSDYRSGVLRFKIHAQLLNVTKEEKNLLEGIEACDFNPDGSVRNEIRSRKAEYDERDPGRKTADFSGDVRILIGRRVELRMDSLHYDLGSGIGHTTDPVSVFSDQIKGSARGVRFNQQQQSLALSSAVDLTMARKKTKTGPESLHATAGRADFSQVTGRILLEGTARIDSESQSLSGDSVEALLDSDQKYIQSVIASGNSTYKSATQNETRILRGDRMVFGLVSGVLEKINVSGQSSFSSATPDNELRLQGSEIDMEFDSEEMPTHVSAKTGVEFWMKRDSGQVRMSGDQFDAKIAAGTGILESILIRERARLFVDGASDGSELQANEIRIGLGDVSGRTVIQKLRAEGSARYLSRKPGNKGPLSQPERTLSASLLEMSQSGTGNYFESGSASGNVVIEGKSDSGKPGTQLRRLFADHADFQFFPGGSQIKGLDADGHVRSTYEKKSGPGNRPSVEEFRTTSEKMKAVFEPGSSESVIKSVSQWGGFTYQDGARSAFSGRCDYDAGKEILELRDGTPRISDDTKSTRGNRIEYDRAHKILSVKGGVRSILSRQRGSLFLGTASSASPASVDADEMLYWMESGRVRYTGKVRLLSEYQNLHTDLLEISDGMAEVEARGSVRHQLLMKDDSKPSRPSQTQEALASDILTTVRSSSMVYRKEKNTINYSGKVTLHSKNVDLAAEMLDAVPDSEGKKIERATARGNVTAHAGVRDFRGDVADYYADPEKFVITGNPARVKDPASGWSDSPRLTYTKADDRILLEE
jgi:LPS export ABC transporter protein LptC